MTTSIGVDIGGTKTLYALTDENGNILSSRRLPTVKDPSLLSDSLHAFIASTGMTDGEIRAVGFGVCGITDTNTAVVTDAPAVGWYGVELRGLLPDFTVYADNDVNCCALGELKAGCLRGVSDALYIAIGTGIGGAVVAGGRLYRGHNFCAGEVGLFTCRHSGSEGVEERASGSAVNRRSLESLGITSRELFARYAASGEDIGGLVADFIDEIAVLTADCVSLLNPETVVYGGGVSEAMPCVMDRLRERVRFYTPIPVKLELSPLGNSAAAVGASLLWQTL